MRSAVIIVFCLISVQPLGAQGRARVSTSTLHTSAVTQSSAPVTLIAADALEFTGDADSNSPAVWDLVNGRPTLVLLTSTAGRPSRALGRKLSAMTPATPVTINPWPGEGVWMEAVIPTDDDTWYGYYHNERVATACGDTLKVAPRIGAARSTDHGATWTDLGIVLEAPFSTYVCDTSNTFFVGGVGDLDAALDENRQYLYLYFSQYGSGAARQGIAAARLRWADRDDPAGKIEIWSSGVWLPARADGEEQDEALLSGPDVSGLRWELPAPSPIFVTTKLWHDGDGAVDAFWGPSIHWNDHIKQYVMLINRAADETFAQEGIYISLNPRLDDPAAWTVPAKIFDGGSWYPQVIGIEPGSGTDKRAGREARFFMGGHSDYLIRFDP